MLNALLAFLFTCSLSFASTTNIHLGTVDNGYAKFFDYIEFGYTFDEQVVGVKVSFMESGDCSADHICHADTPIYTFKKMVEGLSVQNDQLIFEQDGRQVLCGEFKTTRVFKRRKLFLNGNCEVDVKSHWENSTRIHEIFFVTI